MRTSTVKISKHQFETLLALSEVEQQIGLMNRKTLPESMSFVYSHPKINKFWMKNTYLPLDIVFCSQGKVVDICKGEPLSTMAVGPNIPTDLVVEFPYGTCNKLDIKVGDAVEVSGLDSFMPFYKKFY